MNDTGKILRNRGFSTLGAFILDCLSNQKEPLASDLIENLSQVFPAFNDKSTYHGRFVYIYKKVIRSRSSLLNFIRFNYYVAICTRDLAEEDPRFRFKDVKELTVFTDNVLPAVLRKVRERWQIQCVNTFS